MKRTSPHSLAAISLAALLSGTSALRAADVTYERLHAIPSRRTGS